MIGNVVHVVASTGNDFDDEDTTSLYRCLGMEYPGAHQVGSNPYHVNVLDVLSRDNFVDQAIDNESSGKLSMVQYHLDNGGCKQSFIQRIMMVLGAWRKSRKERKRRNGEKNGSGTRGSIDVDRRSIEPIASLRKSNTFDK